MVVSRTRGESSSAIVALFLGVVGLLATVWIPTLAFLFGSCHYRPRLRRVERFLPRAEVTDHRGDGARHCCPGSVRGGRLAYDWIVPRDERVRDSALARVRQHARETRLNTRGGLP